MKLQSVQKTLVEKSRLKFAESLSKLLSVKNLINFDEIIYCKVEKSRRIYGKN